MSQRLESADGTGDREEEEKQDAEDDERLDEPAEGHEVDEGLDRDGGGERQQTDSGREAKDDGDLASLGGHQGEQSRQRPPARFGGKVRHGSGLHSSGIVRE